MIARVFLTRWKLLLISLLICLGFGVAYLWLATPQYQATVELLVDPRPRQTIENEAAPTGLGSSSLGADAALIQSQIGVITSGSALNALITRFDLLNNPDFGNAAGGQGSLLSAGLKGLLYGPNAASQSALTPQDRALDKLGQAIKVSRAGNTYILGITVESGNPQQAADLANGLAAIYIEQVQSSASASSAESADFLDARLDTLKAEADAARQNVEDYRAANGLISADRLPIGEQQLRDISTQITQVSIATDTARADLEAVRRLAETPIAAGAASSALSSPTIDNLRVQLEQARAEELSLAASLGPRHPSMISVAERRAAAENALRAEYLRMVAQAESQFEAAQAKQQALETMLASYEQRQASANAASVGLQELERLATVKNALYDAFLQRALDVREQITAPASTARTISVAAPSSRPSEPRMVITLAMAVAAGLGLGFALAWLHHLLFGTPSRPVVVASKPAPVSLRPAKPQPTAHPVAAPVASPLAARRRLAGLFQ